MLKRRQEEIGKERLGTGTTGGGKPAIERKEELDDRVLFYGGVDQFVAGVLAVG
jgi:hypothetical protein